MGSSASHLKNHEGPPFSARYFQHHIEQVMKLHKKTASARRKVLECIHTNSKQSMIEQARHALTLAETTRSYFEQLIIHYPERHEVWECYGLFQELTHNELAAENCNRRVATLRVATTVSPRAEHALRKKSLEELAREQELRDNAPHEFLCPITLEIMQCPVIAPDGFTYEQVAIKEWLTKNNRSPLTNLELDTSVLRRNYILHAAIQEYIDSYNSVPNS